LALAEKRLNPIIEIIYTKPKTQIINL